MALHFKRAAMWGERWERGSCLGAHVHPWRIHVNVIRVADGIEVDDQSISK